MTQTELHFLEELNKKVEENNLLLRLITKNLGIDINDIETNMALEININKILKDLGIPLNLCGYNYLKEAISLCLSDFEKSSMVTKILYPEIAQTYSSNACKVEHGIRHAIQVAWNGEQTDLMKKLFKYKPKNSEFIALVTDYIKLNTF